MTRMVRKRRDPWRCSRRLRGNSTLSRTVTTSNSGQRWLSSDHLVRAKQKKGNSMKIADKQAGLSEIKRGLDQVQQWVESHNYRGYEPFDGLSSWARPLTFGNLFAQRLLQQTIRQSPINLRPLMGVRAKDSTKGQGYMAWGYLLLYRATQEKPYIEKAVRCLRW